MLVKPVGFFTRILTDVLFPFMQSPWRVWRVDWRGLLVNAGSASLTLGQEKGV